MDIMLSKNIANELLNIGAVQLNPTTPFTLSSGLKSPIYCDNRLTMSYPNVREAIANGFTEIIKQHYPDVDVIAGTATAGIPHAAWVSQKLSLPMVYVRSSVKSHGKKKQIEGLIKRGDKVVVIEDLVSTGGSSLTAVQALKSEGAIVLGVAAIFTYNLKDAINNFKSENITLNTLTDFDVLTDVATNNQVIGEEQLTQLNEWREDPKNEGWLTANQ